MFNRNHRCPPWNKPEKPSGSCTPYSKHFPPLDGNKSEVPANPGWIRRNSEGQAYSDTLEKEFQELSVKEKSETSRKQPDSIPNNELQQKWQDLVSLIAERLPQGNAKVVLTRFAFHDNVPRKKKQFINFLRSSCHLHDNEIGESVWHTLQEELEKLKEEGTEVPSELFNRKKKCFYRRGRRNRRSANEEPQASNEAPETPPASTSPLPRLALAGPRSKRQPKAQKFEEIEEKLKEKEKEKKEENSTKSEAPKCEKKSYGQMSPFGDEAAKDAAEPGFKWRRTIAEEMARNKGICGYHNLKNTVINCYRSTVLDYTTSEERLSRIFKKKFELFGLTVENRMVVIQKAFV